MKPVPVKDRTISAARTAASGEIIRDAQVLKPADFNQIKAPAGTIAEVAITWTPANSIPQPHIVAFADAQAKGLSMDFEAGTYTFTLQGIAKTEPKTLKPEEVTTAIVTVPADEAGGQEQTPSEPENPGTGEDGGEQGQTPSEPETPGTGEDGDDTGEGTDITLPESDPVAAAELFGTWADEEYGSTFTFNVDYTGSLVSSKGDAHESYLEWAVPEKGKLDLQFIITDPSVLANVPIQFTKNGSSITVAGVGNGGTLKNESGNPDTLEGTWSGELVNDDNESVPTRLTITGDSFEIIATVMDSKGGAGTVVSGKIQKNESLSVTVEKYINFYRYTYTLEDNTLTMVSPFDGTEIYQKQP